MSVFTNRCRRPECECQTVYKILGMSKTVSFRTSTSHALTSPARPSAEMSCEGIAPQNSWNCYIPPNPPTPNHPSHSTTPPLNQPPHTLNHSLYLLSPTYSSTPVPIHPLYYLLYVLYLCYSLLFITDYCPSPAFILSAYNSNPQRLT